MSKKEAEETVYQNQYFQKYSDFYTNFASLVKTLHTKVVPSYDVTPSFQDLFLILSLTTLLMTLFSTYLFQAGLVEVLIRKFRVAGSVILGYILVNMVLHAVWLLEKWAQPESVSTPMLIVLFSLQRCLSPWYYFFYKRAALRVSDPRFYEDIDWIDQQMQTH